MRQIEENPSRRLHGLDGTRVREKEKMIPQKGRKIRIGIVIGPRGLISTV
jgi:hypothetical protein